jgi:hypothetical protein
MFIQEESGNPELKSRFLRTFRYFYWSIEGTYYAALDISKCLAQRSFAETSALLKVSKTWAGSYYVAGLPDFFASTTTKMVKIYQIA